MKNVIEFDNQKNITLISSTDIGSNSLVISWNCDLTTSPVLTVSGSKITPTSSSFEYTIPVSTWNGTGSFTFIISDDNRTDTYTVNRGDANDNVMIQRKSADTFTIGAAKKSDDISSKTVDNFDNYSSTWFPMIEVGETLSTLFGKIKGYLTDLKSKQISALDVYPVGAIYISTVSTDPGDLFGGTWVRIKDRFLLAAGNSYYAGETNNKTTHTLTTAQLPPHTHGNKSLTGTMWNIASQSSSQGLSASGIVSLAKSEGHGYGTGTQQNYDGFMIDASHEHDSVGSGQSFSIMPSYLAVYVWERTS